MYHLVSKLSRIVSGFQLHCILICYSVSAALYPDLLPVLCFSCTVSWSVTLFQLHCILICYSVSATLYPDLLPCFSCTVSWLISGTLCVSTCPGPTCTRWTRRAGWHSGTLDPTRHTREGGKTSDKKLRHQKWALFKGKRSTYLQKILNSVVFAPQLS